MADTMDIDQGKGKRPASAPSRVKEKQLESLPWVEKYRPTDMKDLVSHEDIISTIQNFADKKKLPHLLLYGPPGTGKTSTILACARRMYGAGFNNMILELNASDDRGIDVVRDQIKDFASSQKLFSTGVKLIVLDEADQMTNAAQFALRRVIEKYTKNTRFCIICNNVSKIIPALQSRCTRFRFSPLHRSQMEDRLGHVIRSESVDVTPDGVDAIINLSGGDMRKCLNILQATSMATKKIDGDAVYNCTGQPLPSDIAKIVSWLLNESFETSFNNIWEIMRVKGLALPDILKEVSAVIPDLGLPSRAVVELFDRLAAVEVRLSKGTSDKIQLASLVGSFRIAADIASQCAMAVDES